MHIPVECAQSTRFECVRNFEGWLRHRDAERFSGGFGEGPRLNWAAAKRCRVRLAVRSDLSGCCWLWWS